MLVLPLILIFSRCAVNQDSAVVGNTNGYSTQMQSGLVENKDSRQPSGSPVQLQERYESTEEPVFYANNVLAVSYTHLRAHETVLDLVCRLLLEKKKKIHHSQRNKIISINIRLNTRSA